MLVTTGGLSTAGSGPSVRDGRPCQRAGAVLVEPGDNLREALAHAGDGGTICFGPGIYPLRSPLHPFAGQSLIGHGAVLSGSRVLQGFRHTASGWVVGGQHQQGERNGECMHGARACTYPDDVLREGARLHRVFGLGALRPGTFFFDYPHDRIYVYDDPTGHRLEAMVASTAILSREGARGAGVQVRGFVVEHVASRAQHGAIETGAPGWLITDNTVRVNHGAGITSAGHGFDTWLWGSGILLAGSHDVEVSGNRLKDNAEGIGLIQQKRGRSEVDGTPRRLHDVAIHDNEVWMAFSESGAVEDNGYTRLFSDPTITWADDIWHQSGGSPFMWDDDYLTLEEWHDLGHDAP